VTKLMVALNVTGWSTKEGLGDEVRVTEVAPAPTVWTSAVAPEALPVKFVSALVKVATTSNVPDVVNVKLQIGTTPAATVKLAHRVVDEVVLVNVTVPVGLVAPA